MTGISSDLIWKGKVGILVHLVFCNKLPQTGRVADKHTFITHRSGGWKSETREAAWLRDWVKDFLYPHVAEKTQDLSLSLSFLFFPNIYF